MSYFFLLLSFLFVAQPADPQPTKKTLSINATGKVMLPADRVQFKININAEADSPQAAYKLHQKREKALVDLLDKYDIKENNINYEPISIRKQTHRLESHQYDTTYVTGQNVNLNLSDFDVFEQIQIGLIAHHFDNFSAQFTSSEMKDGKDRALRAAIKKARHQAKIIAEETGVKLEGIRDIEYHAASSPQPVRAYSLKADAASSGSLLKYNQRIPVEATISIKYYFSR